ncbi:heavy metal translocating P-type ATPase [Humidesulfovibrio sp.]
MGHGSFLPQPRLRHRSPGRLRLRWAGLRHPDLRADWLEAWLTHRVGLDSVRVNQAGASLVVCYRERPGVFEALACALAELPPEAYAADQPEELRTEPQPRRLADALFSLALAGAGTLLPQGPRMGLAAGMAAPVLLRGANALLRSGLTAKALDMTTTGFALATGDASSAMGIAAMVVVGEYLRQATEDRTGALLKTLLAPAADFVRVERLATDGSLSEELVPHAKVLPGDLVLVAAGETLAVDGVVERGQALVNKSVISGESAPVEVACGDELPAGCAVVRGRVALRALHTGAQSATARIAAMMERTLREKSRPERESDRLADRLAPLSLLLGAGIYAGTGSARRALAVLTIDYACAVKLSAPVVVKASMYAAARAGVLAKGGSALDALARADTMVFDKTGTLTTGRMAVREICPAPESGLDGDGLLRLAASAEGRWSHPAALALTKEAARRGLVLLPTRGEDCSSALGVRAHMQEGSACREVAVGSARFLTETCAPEACSKGASCQGEALLRAQGRTLVHVAVDGKPVGVIALSDELRPEAGQVIVGLRARGIKQVLLLTGDHKEAALAVLAGLAGAQAPDEVRAGLSPEQKAMIVRDLRKNGACVAVVGDGINDAPALLAGDVGVCAAGEGRVGEAVAAITRDAAGIVLLREGLLGLLEARDIAARAACIMRACFGTGVVVNSALLVAAGAGAISPLAAAALHNGTTFALLSGAGLAASRPLADRRGLPSA